MRACGNCSKSVKKVGEPVLHGVFLDQVIDCPFCGWCGVETEIVDLETYKQEPQQLQMFILSTPRATDAHSLRAHPQKSPVIHRSAPNSNR